MPHVDVAHVVVSALAGLRRCTRVAGGLRLAWAAAHVHVHVPVGSVGGRWASWPARGSVFSRLVCAGQRQFDARASGYLVWWSGPSVGGPWALCRLCVVHGCVPCGRPVVVVWAASVRLHAPAQSRRNRQPCDTTRALLTAHPP